ncbi:hypothetical protein ACSBPU_15610 [Parapusillimonas sp. JC17]|uniref:hypothetical protein n=1 Tax=Parapusillimonas sp. JC17 TaxID=3445768 RepID=UPI003F9EDDFD
MNTATFPWGGPRHAAIPACTSACSRGIFLDSGDSIASGMPAGLEACAETDGGIPKGTSK